MKSCLLVLILAYNISLPQQLKDFNKNHQSSASDFDTFDLLYAGSPNHREIAVKAFQLAESMGFLDTIGITHSQIQDRLEAGAYSEDYESIPGIVGEHFPAPWNQGPDFDFYGFYPFSKIPYGSYTDNLSGWSRGFYHGFDPIQGFFWPGVNLTTIEWANYQGNNFTWDKARSLYESGKKAEAYECLGHLLHLLADLSIPAHVNVINHGISISSLHDGTITNPDILKLIVDEYELALSGGVTIPGYYEIIPSILQNFEIDLNLADSIVYLDAWQDYFQEMAELTYTNNIAGQYFSPPDSNGAWGNYLDGNGNIKTPNQYFLTPISQIAGRWVQISIQSTASEQGCVFPKQQMQNLCAELVPSVVEYSAGLILHFLSQVTKTEGTSVSPSGSYLSQNYPNPFNPSTTIRYTVGSRQNVEIKVYDLLGREVSVLVNEEKPAGNYEVIWNAENISSGLYFYQFKTAKYVETKKMIFLR